MFDIFRKKRIIKSIDIAETICKLYENKLEIESKLTDKKYYLNDATKNDAWTRFKSDLSASLLYLCNEEDSLADIKETIEKLEYQIQLINRTIKKLELRLNKLKE